jgi:hypothetical protein
MNTALLAAACALSGVFVVLLVISILYSRYLAGGLLRSSSNGIVDLTNEHGEIDPEKQIKHLKKSTAEFGIRYEELKFGKMLGKGSQGEVFKATWRSVRGRSRASTSRVGASVAVAVECASSGGG